MTAHVSRVVSRRLLEGADDEVGYEGAEWRERERGGAAVGEQEAEGAYEIERVRPWLAQWSSSRAIGARVGAM